MKVQKWIVDLLYSSYPSKVPYIKLYIAVLESTDLKYQAGYELHHILPKSIFSEYTNNQENVVSITYRQHYLAHYLLTKITHDYRMFIAFRLMQSGNYTNTRLYSGIKTEIANSQRGKSAALNTLSGDIEYVQVNDIDGVLYTGINKGKRIVYDTKLLQYTFVAPDNLHMYSDNKRYIVGTHKNPCAPSKIYWNGSTRSADKPLDSTRFGGYKEGLSAMNNTHYRVLDLITKKYVMIEKDTNMLPHQVVYHGQNLNSMIVVVHRGIQYLRRSSLPFYIKEKYSLMKSNKDRFYGLKLLSKVTTTNTDYDSILFYNKHKGMLYSQCDIAIHSFTEYEFDFTKEIL